MKILDDKHYYFRIGVFSVLAAFILLGIGFFGMSFVSFEAVKPTLDSLANDGHASVDPTVLKKVFRIVRWFGIALIAFGTLLIYFRAHAFRLFSSLGESTCDLIITSSSSLKRAIREEDRLHLSGLLTILLIAIGLRLYFSSIIPMRYDESFTFITYASQPFHYIISNYSFPNNHIFHSVLVRFAYLLFGNEPWALRLPALISGTLLIPVSYLTVRFLFDKNSALLAGALMATSPALIEYSTNARGYMLICLFTMILIGLAKLNIRQRNTAAWVLFVTVSAIGFFTMPNMLYPFGIVVSWMVIEVAFGHAEMQYRRIAKDLIVSVATTLIIVMLLYIPAFTISGDKIIFWMNRFKTTGNIQTFIIGLLSSLESLWIYWNHEIPNIIKWLLITGFFCSVLFHKRVASHGVPVLLGVWAFLIPCLLIQKVIPPGRVWLYLLPVYFALSSAGFVHLVKLATIKGTRYQTVLFNLIPLILSMFLSYHQVHTRSVYYLNEAGGLRNVEGITLFLKDYLKDGDSIVTFSPANYPLLYYFDRHNIPTRYIEFSPINTAKRVLPIVNGGNTLEGIMSRIDGELKKGNFNRPYLLRKFSFSSIYVIERSKL